MDVEAIVRSFEQTPPRKVCSKKDSLEEGVGLQPSPPIELLVYGGILLPVFLIVGGLFGHRTILLAVVYPCILLVLAALCSYSNFLVKKHHINLAQYGVAAIGKVTSLTKVMEFDDTPAPPTRVTVEYEFWTQSGEQVTGTRNTISGWYNQLVQDGPIVIVYLPEQPQIHEPYNSLRYRICM